MIYLVVFLLIVAGAIVGARLLKEDKTNDNSNNDNTNQIESAPVVEEDIEEVTENSIYVRKTFALDKKQAKIEYKYENSKFEIKINNKIVKSKELTNGGDYQIEQLNDTIVIAIKTTDSIADLSIYAFDFKGKEILTIDEYVDKDNYMSLREYGDSNVHDNWAFQITDSTIKVLGGRVNNGAIDGITNPCNKSEIEQAKFTNDTMMAAQYSLTYLGNSKYSDKKIERVNITYSQYKSVFPCR